MLELLGPSPFPVALPRIDVGHRRGHLPGQLPLLLPEILLLAALHLPMVRISMRHTRVLRTPND